MILNPHEYELQQAKIGDQESHEARVERHGQPLNLEATHAPPVTFEQLIAALLEPTSGFPECYWYAKRLALRSRKEAAK